MNTYIKNWQIANRIKVSETKREYYARCAPEIKIERRLRYKNDPMYKAYMLAKANESYRNRLNNPLLTQFKLLCRIDIS
mgnify:CR=1 FL=1